MSLKQLSEQEKEMFFKSDQAEWEAILGTKAVKVLLGRAADQARKEHPERIITSRMVRRKKPQPELHSWKAKSRWCLHGHVDPDTGELVTYAPTPQAEGMAAFLQVAVNHHFTTSFGDVKNAFCQSDRLQRKKGPIFAEPCEGLNLPAGALIEVLVPVYGLDDAPAAWRQTVVNFLTQEGYVRNLVEPCWYSKFNQKTGELESQILIEVDDMIVSSNPAKHLEVKKLLTTRFKFGKWEDQEAEYAGRHIRCCDDRILLDQGKYITEQIHPVALARGRRSQKSERLNEEEFNNFRSLIYKINWVGRETRPEVAGTASIMASRLKTACISDVLTVNKVVNFLRSTADRPLTLWQFEPKKMSFMVCSDAGGVNSKEEAVDEIGLPSDATQGAWMVMTCEKMPIGTQPVKASPIAWRSSKLKRKVFSTFGGETQALLQGVNEVDWLQIMIRDATFGDVQLKNWRNSLSPHMVVMRHQVHLPHRQPQCAVTDAKSLYDCLLREHPSGKQDRKSALELAIVLKDLQDTKSIIKWVPHQKMVVDALTKESFDRGSGALLQFLRSGWISLVDVSTELLNRKEDASFRKRSFKASSDRLAREYQRQTELFCTRALATLSWGNCETKHEEPCTRG